MHQYLVHYFAFNVPERPTNVTQNFIGRASPKRQNSENQGSRSASPFHRTRLKSTPEQPLYGTTAPAPAEEPSQASFQIQAPLNPISGSGMSKAQQLLGGTTSHYRYSENEESRGPDEHARQPTVGNDGLVETQDVEKSQFEEHLQAGEGATLERLAPRTAYTIAGSGEKPGSADKTYSKSDLRLASGVDETQHLAPKPPSPKRETIRSIESDLFDIETPPPPPPKDSRWTKPGSNVTPVDAKRAKRSSMSTTTKTAVTGPSTITTTTTTRMTTQRHPSSSKAKAKRPKQHRSSSSHGLLQSTIATSTSASPPEASKPSRSSHRQSLPPVQTTTVAASPVERRRSSQVDTPGRLRLSAALQEAMPQSTTKHEPTITTTTVPNADAGKGPMTTVSQVAPESANEEANRHNHTIEATAPERTYNEGSTAPIHEESKPIAIEPPPRQTSPVEKMKDEPRSAAKVDAKPSGEDSDEEIVMSSTAYPGQEWRPDFGYGGWEGD